MRSILWALVGVLVFSWEVLGGEEKLPAMSELVKPSVKQQEQKQLEEKQSPLPKLSVEEATLEISEWLPALSLAYFETASGEQINKAYAGTAIAGFMSQEATKAFLKSPALSLPNLFSDLPENYANPNAVALAQAGLGFIREFLNVSGRLAIAFYPNTESGGGLVFAAEIGRDRTAGFEALEKMSLAVQKEKPTLLLEAGKRGGDYIDVLKVDSSFGNAELAFGIIRNYVVISSSGTLAKSLLVAAGGKQGERKTLRASELYRDLTARTDSAAQLRGFVNLPAVLDELRADRLPGVTEWIDFTADMVGRGVVYYDWRADGRQTVEHLCGKTVTDGAAPGLPRRLAQIGKPFPAKGEWLEGMARLVPYRAEFLAATKVDIAGLSSLLEESSNLGSSQYAAGMSLAIPQVFRDVVGKQLKAVSAQALSGELALAFLPSAVTEGSKRWLFLLPVGDTDEAVEAVEKALGTHSPSADAKGVKTFYQGEKRESSPTWALLNRKAFPNLKASCVVLADTGETLDLIIDQAMLGASLWDDKDFAAQIAGSSEGTGCFCYYNLPSTLGTNYRLMLNDLLRGSFPSRFQNAGNTPPSSLLRQYLSGLVVSARVADSEGLCRFSMVSPTGVVPVLGGLLVMQTPSWIREREREYLMTSRLSLQKMWMQLQKYATGHGGFPGEATEGLAAVRRLFPVEQQEEIFTSLAAAAYVGAEEAKNTSYQYVAGMHTNDEPDLPLIYETGAWHYDYDGQLRPSANKEPSDTGEYRRWRLVLCLDGTIKEYTDDEFNRDVLTRLQERQ